MESLRALLARDETKSGQWLAFSSKAEFDLFFAEHQKLFESRWLWGQNLDAACHHSGEFFGYCDLCNSPSVFSYQADHGIANLRESLNCRICNLNSRMRAILGLLSEWLPPSVNPSIYITEQTTDAYRWVKSNYSNVFGSEYFDRDAGTGLRMYLEQSIGREEKLNFQDVTNLSIPALSKDVVISCDVLEHVPDYRKALSQFARVLKPDGLLLLTVPFMDNVDKTTVRAKVDEHGEIEHLLEPEYHGDPLSEHGILAYYNFAWDLLDDVHESGFQEACWARPWKPSSALFNELWCLIARR